jgi:hypothetical protein
MRHVAPYGSTWPPAARYATRSASVTFVHSSSSSTGTGLIWALRVACSGCIMHAAGACACEGAVSQRDKTLSLAAAPSNGGETGGAGKQRPAHGSGGSSSQPQAGSRQQPWQQAGRQLQASAGVCRRELTVDAPTSRQETPGCASSQPIARSTIEKAPSVESAIFCSSAIAAKKAHFPLKVLKAFLQ